MKPSMRSCLLCLSLWLALAAKAQGVFPSADGEPMRYAASIEMPKGYVSGICVMRCDGDEVRGCLFNEFGVTAIDFTYCVRKQKVRLHSVLPMLDKWYIRRVLKKDLRQLMQQLQHGLTRYENERQHITYQLIPMAYDTQGE